MKKVLMFLHDGYADYEASYVSSFLVFSKEAIITTLAPKNKNIISKGGLKVSCDLSLEDEIDIEKYDAILLIGGRYWREVNFTNDKLVEIIHNFNESNKIIASICDATTFLAYNGFLDSVYHSGNGRQYLIDNSPRYQGKDFYIQKQCVIDKNFITSNGTAGIEYGHSVATMLNILLKEERDAWFQRMKKGMYNS